MPKRSETAQFIVGRVERARRLDPSLTWTQAARELGISTSSLSKMRAGTRSGQGRVREVVMGPPVSKHGQKQDVVNQFNVTFKTGDRVASRNFRVEGARTRADALVMRRDPKVLKAVKKQLAAEASAQQRQNRGSPKYTRKERNEVVITGVSRSVHQSKPSTLIRL